MKRILLLLIFATSINFSNATRHVILVDNTNFQFTPQQLTIDLGDTVEWRKANWPTMMHTITSTDIPPGAAIFNYIWQAPADTFFQYVPAVPGHYDYECTPHAQSFNMMGYFFVNQTTGVGENTGPEQVYVSPNPASEYLEIINKPDDISYRIRDIKGSVVRPELYDEKLDVSALQEGIYFLELLFEKPRTIRFIKE